jgi:hypothetical protein
MYIGGMLWSAATDVDTLANGYETWNKLYRKEAAPEFTFKRFFDAVLAAEYRDMSVAELIALHPDNLGTHRLVGKKTAAAAYPPSDRPRGALDLDSVARHSKPGTVSSPVLLVRTKSGVIFLDGVHRVVAANLGRQMVRVCIADLRLSRQKKEV